MLIGKPHYPQHCFLCLIPGPGMLLQITVSPAISGLAYPVECILGKLAGGCWKLQHSQGQHHQESKRQGGMVAVPGVAAARARQGVSPNMPCQRRGTQHLPTGPSSYRCVPSANVRPAHCLHLHFCLPTHWHHLFWAFIPKIVSVCAFLQCSSESWLLWT